MDNLRLATKREEILKIFEDAIAQKSEVILWQKVQLQRKMVFAEFKFINKEENTLLFRSLNNVSFSFNVESFLQVKSEYRSIFFQGKIQLLQENLLIVHIPEQIQVLDLREKERQKLTLKKEHKLFLEKLKDQSNKEWNLKILDITKGGVSVEISAQDYGNLQEGDKVLITAISSVCPPQRLEGEVIYVIPMQKPSQKNKSSLYKMGIKFQKELPETLLCMLRESE